MAFANPRLFYQNTFSYDSQGVRERAHCYLGGRQEFISATHPFLDLKLAMSWLWEWWKAWLLWQQRHVAVPTIDGLPPVKKVLAFTNKGLFGGAWCDSWERGNRHVLCLYWLLTTKASASIGLFQPQVSRVPVHE